MYHAVIILFAGAQIIPLH